MRNLVIAALAVITLVDAASAAQAAVVIRDHRRPQAGVVVRDHRTGPVIRDHRQSGPEIRDHRSPPAVNRPGQASGGVTVTSSPRPRPKKEKVCLLGVACTSSRTVVDIAEKTMPPVPGVPR
jgi:hypothetical protein